MSETPVGRSGLFHVVCRKANGDVRWSEDAKNAVVNEGNADSLDVTFFNTTATSTWFIGLMSGTTGSPPTLSPTDTLAVNGFTEFSNYTGTRPAWTNTAATGGVSTTMTNPSIVAMAMLGTGNIYGMFLCGVTSGTSAVLWATAAFSGGHKPVINGDTLEVTYTITSTAT